MMPSSRLLWIPAVFSGFLFAGSSGFAVEAGKQSWPLFRGGSLGQGVALASLPEKPDVLWTFSSEKGWFESTPAIAGGSVFIGSTNGNLYSLELDSGKENWAFQTELGFTASPADRD